MSAASFSEALGWVSFLFSVGLLCSVAFYMRTAKRRREQGGHTGLRLITAQSITTFGYAIMMISRHEGWKTVIGGGIIIIGSIWTLKLGFTRLRTYLRLPALKDAQAVREALLDQEEGASEHPSN